MFSITSETFLLKHKVSQGYSPAGENAGSLTPFEMTYAKNDAVIKKPKLHHYQDAAQLCAFQQGLQHLRRESPSLRLASGLIENLL